MIAYFDTSAVVPLLIEGEAGGDICRRTWTTATAVVTTRLTYVEASAALARAARAGRLSRREHDVALTGLDHLWPQFTVLEVEDALIRTAARVARRHALRGFDAVHCAAAGLLADPTTVALAGDRSLLRAWSAEGLATIDTSRST